MCSIEDLPYEVLVEILSYLSVTDILSSAERVNRRWKEACHDMDTWKHQLYQPSFDLMKYVIVKEVQRMPKLQGLLLWHDLENYFFRAVVSKCRHLRTLIVTSCTVDHVMMQTLRSNCLNIKRLQIPICPTSSNLTLGEVAMLANLKMLVLISYGSSYSAGVKLLADGCPSLERISFQKLPILKEDLVYFLDKKGGTLRQLEITCNRVGECVLPLLSQCKKLDWLDIECHCEDMEAPMKIPVEQPLDLQNLRTVTFLSLKCYKGFCLGPRVIKLFHSHCLSQLVSLNLQLAVNQPKQFIDSVAENCPLLKRLHLVCFEYLTDDLLMNLPSLQLLEDVSLEGCRIAQEGFIDHLSSCRSLQYLNLSGCITFGEGAMRKIVTLTNLKRLIVDRCDVSGFPFHLVSEHMKNLTYISLYKSAHVDWKGVEELKEKSPLVTIVQEPPIEYVNCSPMLGKFPLDTVYPSTWG